MIVLKLLVPAPESLLELRIHPKSGIVGSYDYRQERLRIDYEGAIYNPVNVKTWEDKVMIAAGRHVKNYPTAARSWVEECEIVPIGTFTCQDDWTEKQFDILDREALNRWLQK